MWSTTKNIQLPWFVASTLEGKPDMGIFSTNLFWLEHTETSSWPRSLQFWISGQYLAPVPGRILGTYLQGTAQICCARLVRFRQTFEALRLPLQSFTTTVRLLIPLLFVMGSILVAHVVFVADPFVCLFFRLYRLSKFHQDFSLNPVTLRLCD